MEMKQILTEWKRYLFEATEMSLNPADFENNYNEFSKKYTELIVDNAFAELFLSTLMRLEVKPLVRSLSSGDKKTLFTAAKMDFPNSPDLMYKIKGSLKKDSVFYWMDNFDLYDLLIYYVNLYFLDKTKAENYKKRIQQSPALLNSIYWKLFEKYPQEVFSIPKLEYYNISSTLKTLNFENFLKKDFLSLKLKDISEPNILDEIRITQKIGKGIHGIVYSTSDDRAIKFFYDSESYNNDMERYKNIADQVFKGKASLEDMHYFESGVLGKSGLSYVLMPKIVPLEKADFYKANPIFKSVALANKRNVAYEIKKGNEKSLKNFDEYKKGVINFAKQIYSGNVSFGFDYDDETLKKSFEQSYNEYKDIIDKIIQAGFRAYNKFGGTDIHQGNIGFFAQKPDQLFYYDM